MTGPPIAPVIPSSAAAVPPRACRCPDPAAHGPARAPAASPGVVYGLARVDASGRVTDQAIAGALGWREGDRLTLTAEPGIVAARRDPCGMVTVPARACLAIPAVLRRRCGLRAGDPVLLAAVPGQDMLAAYSFAVVDQAIRAHGAFPARGRVGSWRDDNH